MLYTLGRALFRFFFRFFCRWEVVGRDNLPARGGVILAPNHISYLDPPAAGSAVRRPVYFMAKRGLFSLPLLRTLLPRVHAFPVSRGTPDRKALRTAQELLKAGEVLVIFPEGTRSRDGKLLPPELGIALLALRAKVPVVPMALIGTNRVMPFDSFLIRPAKIKVRVGKPLYFEAKPGNLTDRARLQAVAETIISAIEELMRAYSETHSATRMSF